MNPSHPAIWFLMFRGKELLLVRDDPGSPWDLPHTIIDGELTNRQIEMMLSRFFSHITVEKSEIVEPGELGGEFSGSAVCACSVAKNTRAVNGSLVWFMSAQSAVSYNLSEQASVAIHLAFVQDRLA